MTVYLDTSALVPIHVEEPSSSAISDMIGALDSLPSLSNFGAGEFSSVISRYIRMELISHQQAIALLEHFDHWLVTSAEFIAIETRDVDRASRIIRRFDLKLRFPDALHIAICANRMLTLATRDQQMAAAAMTMDLPVLHLD